MSKDRIFYIALGVVALAALAAFVAYRYGWIFPFMEKIKPYADAFEKIEPKARKLFLS